MNKGIKRIIAVLLALGVMSGYGLSALAETYSLDNGDVTITNNNGESDTIVTYYTDSFEEANETPTEDIVITGTANGSNVVFDKADGVEVTFDSVVIHAAGAFEDEDSEAAVQLIDSDVTINLEGYNELYGGSGSKISADASGEASRLDGSSAIEMDSDSSLVLNGDGSSAESFVGGAAAPGGVAGGGITGDISHNDVSGDVDVEINDVNMFVETIGCLDAESIDEEWYDYSDQKAAAQAPAIGGGVSADGSKGNATVEMNDSRITPTSYNDKQTTAVFDGANAEVKMNGSTVDQTYYSPGMIDIPDNDRIYADNSRILATNNAGNAAKKSDAVVIEVSADGFKMHNVEGSKEPIVIAVDFDSIDDATSCISSVTGYSADTYNCEVIKYVTVINPEGWNELWGTVEDEMMAELENCWDYVESLKIQNKYRRTFAETIFADPDKYFYAIFDGSKLIDFNDKAALAEYLNADDLPVVWPRPDKEQNEPTEQASAPTVKKNAAKGYDFVKHVVDDLKTYNEEIAKLFDSSDDKLFENFMQWAVNKNVITEDEIVREDAITCGIIAKILCYIIDYPVNSAEEAIEYLNEKGVLIGYMADDTLMLGEMNAQIQRFIKAYLKK